MIIIENITIDEIRYDTDTRRKEDHRYNVNNLSDETPEDYKDVMNMGNCKHWIDKFHKYYEVINLDPEDMSWITKAAMAGTLCLNFPSQFIEELNETVEKYADVEKKSNLLKNGCFVRLEHISLKYGMHGPGPYYNFRNILQSMTSSDNGHSLDITQKYCKIYLLSWKNINKDKEFRIFVYKNRITAISQQHLYEVNDML